MADALSLIGIGVIAFTSTNVDDLVILMAFFADRSSSPAAVVAGQFLGIAALIGASLGGALAALIVPTAYLGLVGFVPIAIGLRMLWRGASGKEAETPTQRGASLATVALLTIANGGDNLSLYIPLFAVHDGAAISVIVATFMVMTALWCGLGYALVRARAVGDMARRVGSAVLPFVLIGLGIYILAKTDVRALLAM